MNASDPSGEVTVTFLPERANIKTGHYENITVLASDKAGNQAKCHFQVKEKLWNTFLKKIVYSNYLSSGCS